MNHITTSPEVSSNRFLISLGFIAFALVAVASPALSYAASYAFVNAAGEVNLVGANNSSEALATAPNIHMRSGVMLLNSQADNQVIGGEVIVR